MVYRLGLAPYEAAWQLQNALAAEIAAGKHPPALLLLEHPHTYTFGRRGSAENLLWDEAERQRRGVSIHWVDRGGDVTYHGPGQLVGYPLLPLSADHVGYVRRLETMLILALMRLGVAGAQIPGLTGVWVQAHVPSHCRDCTPDLRLQPAKIAAIGVKVDARGVSRHGFALNVNPDMSYWDGIIGCGLKDAAVASLADFYDSPPSMHLVMDAVADAFAETFDYQLTSGALAALPFINSQEFYRL